MEFENPVGRHGLFLQVSNKQTRWMEMEEDDWYYHQLRGRVPWVRRRRMKSQGGDRRDGEKSRCRDEMLAGSS